MYKNKTISLVLPAFNEQINIKKSIEEFLETGVFDEIIVIDNNSSDNTAEEIKKTSATYILEKKQGYGVAIRTGLKNCTGDYIVMCEPDGTFQANDIHKLLSYAEQFDCVFGTRTSKSAIAKDAKMQFYLRVGNILVAKFLSYLFFGPTLSDVGCTFKLISKNSYKQMENQLTVIGSELQPEIMVHAIKNGNSIIEIPVNYLARKGYSKITYNFSSALVLALKMLYLLVSLKFRFLFK